MATSTTDRLIIRHFTENDHAFILTLLNDEMFIKKIGNKNINNKSDAINYLNIGPLASYSEYGFGLNLICLKENGTPIGMCGLLKRSGLDHPDLGYAFLPEYYGQGYAHEASLSLLKEGYDNYHVEKVLAITLPDNIRSLYLLKKLGFMFKAHVEFHNTLNNLYEINLAALFKR